MEVKLLTFRWVTIALWDTLSDLPDHVQYLILKQINLFFVCFLGEAKLLLAFTGIISPLTNCENETRVLRKKV